MTRRDFIQTGSLSLAGLAMAGALPKPMRSRAKDKFVLKKEKGVVVKTNYKSSVSEKRMSDSSCSCAWHLNLLHPQRVSMTGRLRSPSPIKETIFFIFALVLAYSSGLNAQEESKAPKLLIFGNSYSHFFEYLPGIVKSKGDSFSQFPMRNSNGISKLVAAEEKIAKGEIKPISAEEAPKLKRDESEAFGWSGMEDKSDKKLYRLKDVLDSKKWDYASFQPHSSWANRKADTAAIIAPAYEYLKKNYPSTKGVYFFPTQYRNDELIFKIAVNGSVYGRAREGYPYTEDQHYLDALEVALAMESELGLAVVPGGTALQNARYDTEWGEVTPDPAFDYLNAKEPAKPNVPKTLHIGFAWRESRKGGVSWVIDSHPNAHLNYLNACLWYEFLFNKSCIGAPAVEGKGGISSEDVKILQRIAHETMKGKLPPLRLMHPESRVLYGNILAARAEKLLKSDDPECKDMGLICWQNLWAYIPEHPKAAEAKGALEKAGKLASAQALADIESKERPERESTLKKIWGTGPTNKADDKKAGRWTDL